MYQILLDGRSVYACTDESRFINEAKQYATVRNATFTLNGQPYNG